VAFDNGVLSGNTVNWGSVGLLGSQHLCYFSLKNGQSKFCLLFKFDWAKLRQSTRLKLPIYKQILRRVFSTSHFLQVVVGSLDTLTERFGSP